MKDSLKLALIADTFPPLKNSGAVQLRDLSNEFAKKGHDLTVILPSHKQKDPSHIQNSGGVRIVKLKAPKTKDINYFQRTLNEFMMPYFMKHHLRRSVLKNEQWDGIIWYSPSIFHGPLVRFLKKSNHCKSYLIIRDIFPEWALEIGLMRKGPVYSFFSAIAKFQYSLADVIGVQTNGNLKYFENNKLQPKSKIEVLPNWLGNPVHSHCPIRINKTVLAGRTVFVYAGNMGVAQGIDIIIELAQRLEQCEDVGFLFVGRGNAVKKLKANVNKRKLTNTLFYDEINPDQIPDLYAQCHIGLIALDSRHKSHNIPGKFLTYMQSGLPVLAKVNAGNDIATLIKTENLGQVCECDELDEYLKCAETLLDEIISDKQISNRCKSLFQKKYSVEKAVESIIFGLR